MERKPQIRLGMMGAVGHGKATVNVAIGKVMVKRSPEPENKTPVPAKAALS
jgi:translation initiation factor 2 gamma subunit (eIF-2gamma)